MRLSRFPITIVLLGVAVAAVAILALRGMYPPVEGWRVRTVSHPGFATLDPAMQARFLGTDRSIQGRYAELFSYLLTGFVAYRSDDGARAHYPGDPSVNGRSNDGLEGFSRMAPLIAAWLSGGRDAVVVLPTFGEVDLPAVLRTGIENGTNPASPAYWGNYDTQDPQYVEAADIALAVWLTRDTVWTAMDETARARLVAWLRQSQSGPADWRFNNWQLFGLLVNRVLNSLEQPVDNAAFVSAWQRMLESGAGEGWFRDDPDSDFDYYNVWSFHYTFYWLTRIDPALNNAAMRDARRDFVSFYRHLITPAGIPITGRSVCYRTAASVPLIVSAVAGDAVVAPGEARRSLDVTWRYFVARGALANGGLTQGYCGADRRVMEAYAGPASCLWGTRSLVVAFSQPADAPFWQAKSAPLRIEQGDFKVTSAVTGWRVTGDSAARSVVIEKPQYTGNPPLKPYTLRNRALSWLLRRPFGFGNHRAQYERASYRSEEPFTGCIQSGSPASTVRAN